MSSEPREPSEEELRAAYEAELKRLRVEHVLLDNVVALANLGMRRTGLAPGTEGERDPAQVRLAIEAIRAMLPLIEQAAPDQVAAIRDAVSNCSSRTSGSAARPPAQAHRRAVRRSRPVMRPPRRNPRRSPGSQGLPSAAAVSGYPASRLTQRSTDRQPVGVGGRSASPPAKIPAFRASARPVRVAALFPLYRLRLVAPSL